MTFGRYLLGCCLLGLIATTLFGGAHLLRRRILPEWNGSPAVLSQLLLGIGALVLVLTVLGGLHALYLPAVIGACVLIGLGMAFTGARMSRPSGRQSVAAGKRNGEATVVQEQGNAPSDSPKPDTVVHLIAIVCTAVLIAEWGRVTLAALDGGMRYYDSLVYHAPFAAHFARSHSIWQLIFTQEDPLTSSYPANAELLQSLGILTFGRDFASLFLNMFWLGTALLASWCIGRPAGRGPLTLLSCLPLLVSPLFTATQPGEATNDIMALALGLAAVALLQQNRRPLAVFGLAGMACGIACGTRLSALAPMLILLCGVTLWRRHRMREAGTFVFGLFVFGSFWYIRNAALAGNPLPPIHIGIGPLSLPTTNTLYSQGSNTSTLASLVTDLHAWRTTFLPGLRASLGWGWPVTVLASIAGAASSAACGIRRLRMLGLVALVALLAYAVTPGSAAAGGSLFDVNLRYAFFGLALGVVLLPLSGLFDRVSRQRWLSALLGVLVIITAISPGTPWIRSQTTGAIACGAFTVVCGLALWRKPLVSRALTIGSAITLVALAVAGGWHEQLIYSRTRFVTASSAWFGLGPIWRWAAREHHQRIGFAGLQRNYPLFGSDLSNQVGPIGVRGPDDAFGPIRSCRTWITTINRERLEFVVIAPPEFPDHGPERAIQQSSWTRRAGGAQVLWVPSVQVRIFRITRPLAQNACQMPDRLGAERRAGAPTRLRLETTRARV